MEIDRKKEVIDICLDLFIENGLTATYTRDLSRSLKLLKEEAVIVCAEEAAIRLEYA